MSEIYSSATETGTEDRNSLHRESTITAKSGFNFYEREGPHSLTYRCEGLSQDWVLQTTPQNPDASHWSPPQLLGE